MTVYLDNAATSFPKPPPVIKALTDFLTLIGASPGRASTRTAGKAAGLVERSRKSIADFFGISDPLRIVLTSNATEALNLGIKGFLKPGDHVISTSMEHNSVIRPLRRFEGEGGEVTLVPCTREGSFDPALVRKSIRPNTRMVIMIHASNVTGGVLPVADVGEICREAGLLFMVDAAQTAGHLPIRIPDLNIHLFACSGHKGLMGPQGTGILYIREDLSLTPLMEGGTGSTSERETQPDFLPDRFEAGTPNTPGIAGLLAAMDFFQQEGLERIQAHEKGLLDTFIHEAKKIKGVNLYLPSEKLEQMPVASFNIAGLAPSETGFILESAFGIEVRVGLHCSPLAHRSLGTFPHGAVRISPGYFNTKDDITALVEGVKEIARRRGGLTGAR